RRVDDAVDVARREARVGEGGLSGLLREVAAVEGAVGGHVAPLADAGARAHPLVAGLHLRGGLALVALVEELELLVGDDAVGDVRAQAEDDGTNHLISNRWGREPRIAEA